MSLILHKVGLYSEDDDNHVFTFVLDGLQRNDVKTVESSEVNYGGHQWTVVCTRKEDNYVGIFLKWRYNDGSSLSSVTAKVKYTLTLIHRHDYNLNQQFATTQRFTSAQSMLGKSRFVTVADLFDLGAGFVDETGRRAIIELSFGGCMTRFERSVDISPPSRVRKNASGVYFDTPTFQLASHRWYIRFYAKKVNSNGLPAVYLYLAGKSKGVAVDVQFVLYLARDCTEILTYSFGDYAKFDGFGKTLPEPLANVDRLTEMTVAVEVRALTVYKIAPVRLFRSVSTPSYASRPAFNGHSSTGASFGTTPPEAFQDHEGNVWRAEVQRDEQTLTISLDKGVHHYQNNRTKILCWSALLLSRDQQRAPDIAMSGQPIFGYFSNFIDEKGYMMSFPVHLSELEDRGGAYVDEAGEVLIRLNLLSLQTTPLSIKTSPRFDYQFRHLLRARQELHLSDRSLQEIRDMSASRASLSLLDEPNSRNTSQYKSTESLDAISVPDGAFGEDYSRPFVISLLRHLAVEGEPTNPLPDGCLLTGRDVSVSGSAVSEDSSTESGLVISEDSASLLSEARANSLSDNKHHQDIVSALVKLIQCRVPFRVSHVIEAGSLGTNTVARSRTDVDLILVSPDVPRDRHARWMPALLRAVANVLQQPAAVGGAEQLPGHCTDWHVTSHAVQFNCAGVDVDVTVTFDWNSAEGGGPSGFGALYDVTCRQTTVRQRQWYALGSARQQRKIIADQPNEVKELIKVLKHWRNEVQWRKVEYRPNSYLLSLLVIKAVEESSSVDPRRIIQRVGSYVLAAELRLSWSTFYDPSMYPVEFNPPSPVVRDPANPGVNVAEWLPYWGQLRTEYAQWLRSLNITVSPLGS